MSDQDKKGLSDSALLQMTTDIVSSFLSKNTLDICKVPKFIEEIYCVLKTLDVSSAKIHNPAISVRRSVTPDYLVCLEDGRKLKMLKRYLRTSFNLSPDEYRRKWDLPSDYPMVAPNYAKRRSEFAKKTGFGKKNYER